MNCTDTNTVAVVGAGPNVKSMLRLGLKEVPAEYPMRLWDTMRWSDTTYQHGELGPILDGHVPDNFVFDDTAR